LRRQTSANHEPVRLAEARVHQVVDFLQLAFLERQADFVQLYGEPLLIRDGEIGPAFGLDLHDFVRKAELRERLFDPLSDGAAAAERAQGCSPELMNLPKGVDASPACGLRPIENIGAIFKNKFVDTDGTVDCGIYR